MLKGGKAEHMKAEHMICGTFKRRNILVFPCMWGMLGSVESSRLSRQGGCQEKSSRVKSSRAKMDKFEFCHIPLVVGTA